MSRLKKIWVLVLAVLLVLTNGTSAFAATKKDPETRTPILTVALDVKSYVEAGDESVHAEVTSSGSQYSVGNIDWGSVSEDGFKVGDEPKISVYLHAKAGHYFDRSVNTKKVIVNGAKATNVKKQDNDETLVVTVQLGKVKGELGEIETAEWKGYPLGRAVWDKAENAKAYELKLYRDGQVVYGVEKCVGTSFDFYPYMTESGTYQFRVRAVAVSTEEAAYLSPGEWIYSDSTDISADETSSMRFNDGTSTSKMESPANVGWREEQEGWRYRLADGSYVKDTWQMVNGIWYYFGYDGYMRTGWQQIAGAQYYLGANGDLQTGWLQYDKEWYFLNPSNGSMQTGWNLSNGKWYYMNPSNGILMTGWQFVNGKWYYLDSQDGGAMAVNRRVGGYYVNQEGVWVQ